MYVQLAAGQTGTFAFSFVPPALTSGVMLFVVALVASALAWNLALAPVIADRAPGARSRSRHVRSRIARSRRQKG